MSTAARWMTSDRNPSASETHLPFARDATRPTASARRSRYGAVPATPCILRASGYGRTRGWRARAPRRPPWVSRRHKRQALSCRNRSPHRAVGFAPERRARSSPNILTTMSSCRFEAPVIILTGKPPTNSYRASWRSCHAKKSPKLQGRISAALIVVGSLLRAHPARLSPSWLRPVRPARSSP